MSKYLTTAEFIEKAKALHGYNLYDYSCVKYVSSRVKVEIRCVVHGIFLISPNSHLNGSGCSKCSHKKSALARMTSMNDFIAKANIVHNHKYKYIKEMEYVTYKTKVKIICPIHNFVFPQTIGNHLRNHGCPKCANNIKTSMNDFIYKASIIHGNKYTYDKNQTINNENSKILINCPLHGEFIQDVGTHIGGKGCRKCGVERIKESLKLTYSEFVERAGIIHGNKYTYPSNHNYINVRDKIEIICPIHGNYIQEINSHLSGRGCNKCKSPKGERLIISYANQNNIEYFYQYKFKNSNIPTLKFDFYLPNYRLLIEYNGGQHYKSIEWFGGTESYIKQISRDKKKKDFAKRNHYHFLEIPYFSKNPTKLIDDKIKEITAKNRVVENNQMQMFQ
jgi:hypothetical protein